MNQVNLDQLSDAAIKKLWQAKQAKDRQQLHDAEQAALTDMGVGDEGYYKDAFGNVIEGKKPTPKTVGHYVDASGYVQELAPGEKAPELSGNGLVDWLKNQDVASGPELRAALGEENLYFEERVKIGDSDISLIGCLESNGWLVTSRSDGGTADLKFWLARNLTRDEAIEQAVGYVETQAGPLFKNLTDNELRMAERMAVGNRLSAFVFFIQCRLPEHLADRFLELGAAGDELAILNFAAAEKISEICEEGVMNAFHWSNPKCTEDFFDYVRAHDGNRVWTFSLLDSLWNQYQVSSALDRLAPEPQPTPEDLEDMSDEEIERTLLEARKLRAGR